MGSQLGRNFMLKSSKFIKTPHFQDHRAAMSKHANHANRGLVTKHIIMFRWKLDFFSLIWLLVTFASIRHGQYNIRGATDAERILTEMGKMQAKFAGQRLRNLKLTVTEFVISTMARAQETAKIILSRLPEGRSFSIRNDSMLEEGAPIPPIPEHRSWQPDFSVK